MIYLRLARRNVTTSATRRFSYLYLLFRYTDWFLNLLNSKKGASNVLYPYLYRIWRILGKCIFCRLVRFLEKRLHNLRTNSLLNGQKKDKGNGLQQLTNPIEWFDMLCLSHDATAPKYQYILCFSAKPKCNCWPQWTLDLIHMFNSC